MGDEPYFIDKISDYITEHVLTDAEKGFNQTILYGKDLSPQTIIDNARRFPMMSNHQVIIVREAQNIKEIEELESYVKNPLRSTILVICYKYKTLDKRKTLAKTIDQKGILFEAKKIYDNQLPAWISNYLKIEQYTITPQAAALLAEYLGADLSKVANELDKLMITLKPGTSISPDHIERNIGISKEYNVFELQNAIGERDILRANRIINYFGSNPGNNQPPMIIASLFGYFSKILSYHFLEDKSQNNAASVLQVNPFFVKNYSMAAKNYSIRKLVEIISILREYDMKLKGFGNATAPAAELQREMIYKILH
jgi:DNA polymerase-3 subunit delta